MQLSIDEAEAFLNETAESFPAALFDELNGGVNLLEDTVPDPNFPPGEMYILGEYCHDQMGRYINLYYGSFEALAKLEGWTDQDWEDELYDTLAHEFTHHIEGLAGERGLEVKDEAYMEQFRDRRKKRGSGR